MLQTPSSKCSSGSAKPPQKHRENSHSFHCSLRKGSTMSQRHALHVPDGGRIKLPSYSFLDKTHTPELPMTKATVKEFSWTLMRITEWVRLERTTVVTWCNLLVPTVLPVAQDCIQTALEYLQAGRLHTSLSNLCSVTCTATHTSYRFILWHWNIGQ